MIKQIPQGKGRVFINAERKTRNVNSSPLVDEAKRNELMILYMGDLSGIGLTAADLAEGGRAAARWDDISNGLLERAVKGMKIRR